ncbi:7-methylxanthosine synthase 1 isoform X4 [Eucalyptus grandis]|uniref:7-methylxanthosine synthase 1 isoform X4 n=1 Tax=Eucalyptus grandis TaxID=71139 RepID=UPI00192EA34A|nr:7-methylxanthosine synthase 1 isoform X4 [Eucalyptus grandis]
MNLLLKYEGTGRETINEAKITVLKVALPPTMDQSLCMNGGEGRASYAQNSFVQAPANLVSEFGSPLNKGHIYLARTTPKSVHEAYLDLFKRDMTLFLKSRSEELILGGRMLFTMIGRDASVNLSEDQVSNIYELLGMTISDMVQECGPNDSLLQIIAGKKKRATPHEGLIEEEKLDDWNMPIYLPTPEEVRHVIQKEGSFHITRFETFKVTWDAEMGDDDLQMRGKYAAATIRAVFESILTTHFGEEIMDGLFEKFASKVSQYMKLHEGEYFNILVSVKNG